MFGTVCCTLVISQISQVITLNKYVTIIDSIKTCKTVEQRCLATAARTHDSHHLSLSYYHINFAQRLHT